MITDLFGILMLISFICLIVGAIKPALFSRLLKREITRKKALWIFGSTTIVLFILVGITSPKQPQSSQKQTASNQTQQTQQAKPENKPAEQPKTNVTQVVAQKTDQEKLEDALKNDVSKATGTTDVNYKGLEVDKADKDRPAGTKMLTISINTTDFYDKKALIRDTGKLSSALFQDAFNSNLNAYNVIIWYRGKVKDRYGNEKDDVILTYAMDKPTFGKMNWANFDKATLCDFLNQEDRLNGNNLNTTCNSLVNIQ